MNNFESNIFNIYGKKGKDWLLALSAIVDIASSKFGLSDLRPMAGLSYNYILSGLQGDKEVILKVGMDNAGLKKEAFALRRFNGFGAVNIFGEIEGALLLEKIIPGISLKSYFAQKDANSVEIACMVMKRLHKAGILKKHNFPHIKDLLSALDKDWPIDKSMLQKARLLRDKLLDSAGPDILLHGDLHHDNILRGLSEWIVIDPKGVIGEAAYEIGAFIRNPMPELLKQNDILNIIQARILAFSHNANVSSERIAAWCFVQSLLSWIWAIEDKTDASCWKQLTMIFDKFTVD